jgi:hypothetical protein
MGKKLAGGFGFGLLVGCCIITRKKARDFFHRVNTHTPAHSRLIYLARTAAVEYPVPQYPVIEADNAEIRPRLGRYIPYAAVPYLVRVRSALPNDF